MRTALLLACIVALGALAPDPATAHGLAGKRFFPATLAVDDPFVADELSLPTVVHRKVPARGDEPATRETEVSAELAKRLTRDLGVSLEGELVTLDPERGPTRTGFGNLEVGVKYQLFLSAAHEAIVSLALGWEVGGTGRKAVEAESFDAVRPAVFFGKGFGDLPELFAFVRPLALTGFVGAGIPTRSSTRTASVNEDGEEEIQVERHPNTFRYGVTLQYSTPYLQSFVRDVGLPRFLGRTIPLVELEAEQSLDRGEGGVTRGTVNPGIVWSGKLFQVGLEAVVPINDRTGTTVGIRAQLHFYLDDLLPRSLGRPLFGR